jgi:predicted RNase H-like nuclease (RuvC/YqgF family)
MQELQKTNADLSTSKAELEKKIESLEQVSVKFAKQGEELKKLTKENEALEIEQQDLAAELAQHKEKVVELETLRAENEALKKSSQQSTEVRGTPVDADLEAQLQESKAELEQWKVLAEVCAARAKRYISDRLTTRSAATMSTRAYFRGTSNPRATAKPARRRTRKSPS